MVSVRGWFGIMILLVAVTGCDTGPALYPATGTVTYEGKPVAGAGVTFIPADGGTFGLATTDAQGKFAILTNGKAGAPVGTYKVTVAKSEVAGMPSSPTPDDMKKMAAGGGMKSKSLVPEVYSDAQKTTLTATVGTDGTKNVFPLDLK